jgi:integral membrane sensor domain MASE1/two-component sensor histidine kinase
MISFLSWRNARECLLGAIGIYVLGFLALKFYAVNGTRAVPLWPSSGLALGLLLLRGWRLFPAIILGSIPMLLTSGFNSPIIILGPLANAIEALTGWFLLIRLLRFSPRMGDLRDIRNLITVGATVGPFLHAILCTAILTPPGSFEPEILLLSTLLFFIGDALGIIVFTPIVLALGKGLSFIPKGMTPLKWALITGASVAVVIITFQQNMDSQISFPLAFLPFPILLWTTLSLGIPGTALAVALVTTISMGFTVMGRGPFVYPNPLETYGHLTVYILVITTTNLVMASVEDARSHGHLKKRLSTLTAGLGYWEWMKESGWKNLGIIKPQQRGEVEHLGFPPILPDNWGLLVEPGQMCHLPWNQLREGMESGRYLSGDISISNGHPGAVFEVTGLIVKTDTKGLPTSLLGTIRDVTAERRATFDRLRIAQKEMEIRSIRSQLNSHFLFNSLNVIKALISVDAAKCREAVVSLSELLRSSLRITRSTLIPLSEEMKVIRSYLDLQAIRYGDHLSLSVTIGPHVDHLMVPPMLFHQLVENAFKHGVDAIEEKCFLAIRAERDGNSGDLRLSVTNSGRLGQSSPKGLGLGSIREQLAALYGKPASFTITQEPHDLVLAVIRIPIAPSEASGISEVSGNSGNSRFQEA